MRLLLDEDLSPKIAAHLRALGVDAVSVHDIGRRGLSDRDQLEFAAEEDRCIVTRNRNDFIVLTQQKFARGEPHKGVLVLSCRLPPDDFGSVARALSTYLDAYGERPRDFLFDFISAGTATA